MLLSQATAMARSTMSECSTWANLSIISVYGRPGQTACAVCAFRQRKIWASISAARTLAAARASISACGMAVHASIGHFHKSRRRCVTSTRTQSTSRGSVLYVRWRFQKSRICCSTSARTPVRNPISAAIAASDSALAQPLAFTSAHIRAWSHSFACSRAAISGFQSLQILQSTSRAIYDASATASPVSTILNTGECIRREKLSRIPNDGR